MRSELGSTALLSLGIAFSESKQNPSQRRPSSSPLYLMGHVSSAAGRPETRWGWFYRANMAGCSLPCVRSPCSSFLSQNLVVSSWSKSICSYFKMSYTVLDSALKKKEGRKILHLGESFCLITSSRCHRLKKPRKFQAKGRYFIRSSTPPG